MQRLATHLSAFAAAATAILWPTWAQATTASTVPEPSSWLLAGLAAAAAAIVTIRNRRK